jgi:cysteinyl-tRNA synthetase
MSILSHCLQKAFDTFVSDIMGIRLKDELSSDQDNYTEGLMDIILELRAKARDNKDWPTSDLIRDKLSSLNIQVKDGKEGVTWSTSK